MKNAVRQGAVRCTILSRSETSSKPAVHGIRILPLLKRQHFCPLGHAQLHCATRMVERSFEDVYTKPDTRGVLVTRRLTSLGELKVIWGEQNLHLCMVLPSCGAARVPAKQATCPSSSEGNDRTQVFRVTGGDHTHHHTTEDLLFAILCPRPKVDEIACTSEN